MKTYDQVKQERKEAARLQVINALLNGEEAALRQIANHEAALAEAKVRLESILAAKDNEDLTLDEATKLAYPVNKATLASWRGGETTVFMGGKIEANQTLVGNLIV